jgi:hypothetical protein
MKAHKMGTCKYYCIVHDRSPVNTLFNQSTMEMTLTLTILCHAFVTYLADKADVFKISYFTGKSS